MKSRRVTFSSHVLAWLALGLSPACGDSASSPPVGDGPDSTGDGEGNGMNGGASGGTTGGTPAPSGGTTGNTNPEDPSQGTTGLNGTGMGGGAPDNTGMNPVVTPLPCEGDTTACPLPAFPGADGAGGYVTGGRGGDVYHVTRLDTDFSDVNPGTLRFGLSNLTGPRTIVFDISGVFSLGRTAVAGWDDNGNGWDTASRLNIPANVTIAGQTAPGPVIITGGVIKAGGTNFILRNVTIAPGYGSRGFDEPERAPVADTFPSSYVFDAIDISGNNLIIDHVTTVYATDETVSMNEQVTNATVQYSNISLGQNYPQADAEANGAVRYTGHALGSLLQGGSNAKVSIHHNLYAQLKGRLPRVGTEADALTVPGVGAFNDFRNNVFYNWFDTAGTGASAQPSQNNFIGNFYLAGAGGDDPSGGASTALTTKTGGTRIFDGNDVTNTKVHHSGNLKDVNLNGNALDGLALTDLDFIESSLQASAFVEVPYAGVTDAADVAFARVLEYVGSRYWERGAIDQRLVADVRAGTGKIVAWADDPFNASADEGTEWRTLVATPAISRPAGFDTDRDGMPDAWEVDHALDPAVADNNGDFDSDGYTNLEEYINEIAAWPAATPAQFLGRKNNRYAQIENWSLRAPAHGMLEGSAPWQPGPKDSVQISSGVVLVDAVGQHAETLEVSASSGLAALQIESGWLDVEGSVFVGSTPGEGSGLRQAGSGQVVQTGGRLRVRRAVVLGAEGASAEYALCDGVLGAAQLVKASGSLFGFAGGTLHADVVGFDLRREGGVLWPGRLTREERKLESQAPELGYLRVVGDLELGQGELRIALGADASDAVFVSGDLTLGGSLDLIELGAARPKSGASWTLLTAVGQIRGAFERVPTGYRIDVRGQRVTLTYGAAASSDGEHWVRR